MNREQIEYEDLTPTEKRIVEIFHQLSYADKLKVLKKMDEIIAERDAETPDTCGGSHL